MASQQPEIAIFFRRPNSNLPVSIEVNSNFFGCITTEDSDPRSCNKARKEDNVLYSLYTASCSVLTAHDLNISHDLQCARQAGAQKGKRSTETLTRLCRPFVHHLITYRISIRGGESPGTKFRPDGR